MADKELFRVRVKFVDKVSDTIIEQLLDGLLEDRVVNDGEKDSLLEINSKANKARKLLDVVRKKGATASTKLIFHLEQVDPTLCTELGLSSGPSTQTDQPAAQTAPTTTVWTVEEFWKNKQKDPSVYRVTKENYRNRIALMVTNIEFAHETKRNGAQKDEENMEDLLKILGYEVVKYKNLTGKEIEEALKEFIKNPKLKDTDSVIVVIMSHGKLGAILGVNWKHGDENPDEFPIDNIFKLLGPENCPQLVNKPKVIIVQACRGGQRGAVYCSDAPMEADDPQPIAEGVYEDDKIQLVHKEKDFIPILSCTPDTVSYRHSENGSLLIQFIAETFKKDSHKDHIFELFRKVMQRFDTLSIGNSLQMPTIDRYTLTKNFYLFPGLVGKNP